jgi:hypothetical protein
MALKKGRTNMKNIPEHYLYIGTRTDNRETVTGLLVLPWRIRRCTEWNAEHRSFGGEFLVDPATVEPVAVPVMRERHLMGDYRCPNCRAAFVESLGRTDYCGNCGQRLAWTEGE